MFAWSLAHLTGKDERAVAERKQRLFADVSGAVVEVASGAGANFRYYPRGIRWIGIEPNPYMGKYVAEAAKRQGSSLTCGRVLPMEQGRMTIPCDGWLPLAIDAPNIGVGMLDGLLRLAADQLSNQACPP